METHRRSKKVVRTAIVKTVNGSVTSVTAGLVNVLKVNTRWRTTGATSVSVKTSAGIAASTYANPNVPMVTPPSPSASLVPAKTAPGRVHRHALQSLASTTRLDTMRKHASTVSV